MRSFTSVIEKGLGRWTCAPWRRPKTAEFTEGTPVISTTGVPGSLPLTARSRSSPLRPGILMSDTTRSKGSSPSCSSACSAVDAVVTWQWFEENAEVRNRRTEALSSTSRTRSQSICASPVTCVWPSILAVPVISLLGRAELAQDLEPLAGQTVFREAQRLELRALVHFDGCLARAGLRGRRGLLGRRRHRGGLSLDRRCALRGLGEEVGPVSIRLHLGLRPHRQGWRRRRGDRRGLGGRGGFRPGGPLKRQGPHAQPPCPLPGCRCDCPPGYGIQHMPIR